MHEWNNDNERLQKTGQQLVSWLHKHYVPKNSIGTWESTYALKTSKRKNVKASRLIWAPDNIVHVDIEWWWLIVNEKNFIEMGFPLYMIINLSITFSLYSFFSCFCQYTRGSFTWRTKTGRKICTRENCERNWYD